MRQSTLPRLSQILRQAQRSSRFPRPPNSQSMESRKLAALLASLVSELVLLIFLLFPSSIPLSLTFNSTNSYSYGNSFSIIRSFLSSQEMAAALFLLSKRKRPRLSKPDFESTGEKNDQEIWTQTAAKLGLTQNPDSYKNCFNMTSSTFQWLSGLLEPLLDCRDPAGSPLNLSANVRLGIGLFRLATGSEYREISKQFGVSESAARFCAKQLCRVLCTNFRFWVSFPSSSDLEAVSNKFESLTGLPNCCGFIHCARFKIVKGEASEDRREEDSVAIQIVVDSSSKILGIFAGLRGDKSDLRVLKLSTLYKDVEEGRLLNSSRALCLNGVAINQYLVGDGGYPLLPWLMLPFKEVIPGSAQEKFNSALNLMRLSALRTVSSLKHWGVLSKTTKEDTKTVVAYMGACSILHNALLIREDYSAVSGEAGDCSSQDQCSELYRDGSLEVNSVERKAASIRSALAARARDFCESRHSETPSSLAQLQSK